MPLWLCKVCFSHLPFAWYSFLTKMTRKVQMVLDLTVLKSQSMDFVAWNLHVVINMHFYPNRMQSHKFNCFFAPILFEHTFWSLHFDLLLYVLHSLSSLVNSFTCHFRPALCWFTWSLMIIQSSHEEYEAQNMSQWTWTAEVRSFPLRMTRALSSTSEIPI